jgi:hypothetical protein
MKKLRDIVEAKLVKTKTPRRNVVFTDEICKKYPLAYAAHTELAHQLQASTWVVRHHEHEIAAVDKHLRDAGHDVHSTRKLVGHYISHDDGEETPHKRSIAAQKATGIHPEIAKHLDRTWKSWSRTEEI